MKTETKRSFRDVETNELFHLYIDSDTKAYHLISKGSKNLAKGCEVNGFYICAHTSVAIKINGSKVVSLPVGTFYNTKEGETITHKKFAGFKRFSKV